ncbi:MAG: hypothetical protein ACFFEV_05785, partial [Candidatus Thorarchaeota archaeon]
MSSVIVNPTRRAENSIYLVFSVLVIASLQYAIDIFNPVAGFQPDIIATGLLGSLLATFLMYPALEKRTLEYFLIKKVEEDLSKKAEFILNSVFLLESYRIVTQKIPEAETVLLTKTREVLDGEELTVPMWKLRAAIIFTLSLPFSGIVVFYYFRDIVTLFSMLFVLLISIVLPSWTEYQKTANTLSKLIQFHWFDELLTAVRRSEITADYNPTIIDLRVDGLAANIRAGKGIKSSEKVGYPVPKYQAPMVSLSETYVSRPVVVQGEIRQQSDRVREERR